LSLVTGNLLRGLQVELAPVWPASLPASSMEC
jgi:hypothetical protein